MSFLNSLFCIRNPDIDKIKEFDIERIAIDQSGNLGSLYDECQDMITGRLNTDLQMDSVTPKRSIACTLYKGQTNETENLLDTVGIDESLRLSIILNIIQPSGIASIVNYSQPIDEYTRFLYYCQTTIHESCHADLIKTIKSSTLIPLTISATHIISEIVWGIHVIIILQLPTALKDKIDSLLEQMCRTLRENTYLFEMTAEDKDLLNQIIFTTICSNIPSLTSMTQLYDVWQRVLKMRGSFREHRRVKYRLSPIKLFYQNDNMNNVAPTSRYHDEIKQVEPYVFQQWSDIRMLQACLNKLSSQLVQDTLAQRLHIAQQSFVEIKQLYDNNLKQIRDLIIRLRQKQDVLQSIKEVLNSDVQQTIQDSIQRLTLSFDNLSTKAKLIKQLQSDGFQYWDVSKLGIDHECSEQLVKDILFKNTHQKLIFCANDKLKQQTTQQWDTLYTQMIEEQYKNPQLNCIYADFTYSTWCLAKMIIVSSKQQTIDRDQAQSHLTSQQGKRKAPPPPLKPNDKYINILLLGESGVGKSTFINAFANYLYFKSLKQAQHGQPVAVIPVSFVMTTNDSFDEEVVKFGEVDSNENHANTGQSVTQQCRTYVFDIAHQKKLRIIDTPGFGDTRGSQQDDNNMNIIFSFLNNITHVNAICLLLKPNVGQLNPYLHSCLIQLFDYFGEDIRNHLVFCFTNARSTFFAPGDTRPLLQSLLDSLRVKKIGFEKANTFCFDSESFRYLVALQNGLIFNDIERGEYEQSWRRSVEESNRLRTYLCENLHPYHRSLEWQSIRDAQFQISRLIRPMLESIRNILRNILLYDNNCSIKLKASCVEHPTTICYKCNRTPKLFNSFWIFLDHTHTSINECTSNEQILTEYTLNYEYINKPPSDSKEVLNQHRNVLFETCIIFARFLLETESKKDDLFLSGFTRMQMEEESISQRQKHSDFNKQLVVELKALMKDYQQQISTTDLDKENEPLSDIYKLIMSVNEIPIMKEQLNAIREYQHRLLISDDQNVDMQSTFL